jgi:predicted peptidase
MLPLLTVTLLIGCGSPPPVAIPEAAELEKFSPGTHTATAKLPDGETLKYTIEVPAGYDGKTPVPLLLALHYGYDGAKPEPYTGKGMIEAFRPGLADLKAIVIAPDALGGDWKDAKNEKAAVWLTRSAQKTYAIDPKKVVVVGYSMGGEGTWFIGSRHQDVFTGAIPVAAPVAGGEEAWKIPVYVIHSDKDEVVSYSSAKKHADALKKNGTKLEFKTVSGLTHYKTASYGPYLGDAVKWLQAEWK